MATKLTDERSIEKIIQEMALEEKALVVTGGAPFRTEAQEKYGIPSTLWLDGGTGFNQGQYAMQLAYERAIERVKEQGQRPDRESFGGIGGLLMGIRDRNEHPDEELPGLPSSADHGCYPPGIFLGASWNADAIEACGRALGEEMNYRGVDVLLGTPNVNIHRDPRNGRLFEGYSEDPFLVSQLAPAFVKGIRSGGVIADVKHFAANNQETDRIGVNEHIPERALREIYLPGFEACVKAGCETVMSAYNSINGIPCAQNPRLLGTVLREEWGFDGVVVSDWSAAYDQVAALQAGNDLAMPGPRGIRSIIKAVHEGQLSEETLDRSVRRILRLILKMPAMAGRKQTYDRGAGLRAAERIAQEGMILLKNNGVLPLKKNVRIAFLGKRSRDFAAYGAGSAEVESGLITNPFDSMCDLIGPENVSFGEAKPGTSIWIVTVGANGQEGADRRDLSIDEDDAFALEQAIGEAGRNGGKVILLLNTEGPVELTDFIDRVDAAVCAFYPGMLGGKVFCDLVLGTVVPSGKLPLTWPRRLRDCPAAFNFPGENKEVIYGEGIYVGYRYYDIKGIRPLFPFGFGLSYTSFGITGLALPATADLEAGDLNVSVTIKNTGSRDGKEVIQLYTSHSGGRLDRPVKELKAFRKVFLKAGEEKTVTLTVTKAALAAYSTALSRWVTEPGAYTILVGTSSAEIAQAGTVTVTCEDPFLLTEESRVADIAANKRAVGLIDSLTGLDFAAIAGKAKIIDPQVGFREVWSGDIVPILKRGGQHDPDTVYRAILEGFRTL